MPMPGLRDRFPHDPARPTDPSTGPRLVRDAAPEAPVDIASVDVSSKTAPSEAGPEVTTTGTIPDTLARAATPARTPARELAEQIQHGFGELKIRVTQATERVRNQIGEHIPERIRKRAATAGRNLKQELAEDVDYVKVRARHYHEHEPLKALGVVAAAGLLGGIFIGLRRR